MKQRQIAWWLWAVGSALIVSSWFRVVSSTVGWCGFGLGMLGSIIPPMDQPINNALALLATAYRIVISVGGAWLTARLAPDKPMKHAMILGLVGVVLGLVGVVATWNLGLGPRWYPISLAALAIPQCWVGGWIYELQSGKR